MKTVPLVSAATLIALCPGLAAQPLPRAHDPAAPAASSPAPAPSLDPGIVKTPPAHVDPESINRPPPRVDPGMIEKPPTARKPVDRGALPKSGPSGGHDCPGPAERCKRDSAR